MIIETRHGVVTIDNHKVDIGTTALRTRLTNLTHAQLWTFRGLIDRPEQTAMSALTMIYDQMEQDGSFPLHGLYDQPPRWSLPDPGTYTRQEIDDMLRGRHIPTSELRGDSDEKVVLDLRQTLLNVTAEELDDKLIELLAKLKKLTPTQLSLFKKKYEEHHRATMFVMTVLGHYDEDVYLETNLVRVRRLMSARSQQHTERVVDFRVGKIHG